MNLSFNNLEEEVPMRGIFANTSVILVERNKELCGGNSELGLPRCAIELSNRPKVIHPKKIFLILSIAYIVFRIIVMVSWLKCKRKVQFPHFKLLEDLVWRVPYESLYNATNQFSFRNLVSVGRYGAIYKRILGEDGSTIAVKVFKLQHQVAGKSFIIECEVWRHIRHRNLVKIITSCYSTDFLGNEFKALVYEFMPKGSLETWLHQFSQKNQSSMSIAIDVAIALNYLYQQCHKQIVHCDLKPSNILLDNNMVVCIEVFGIAKLLSSTKFSSNSSSIGVRGTIGYTSPEYGLGGEVFTKGDVYSYENVLLKMMTGKKHMDKMFQEGLNLHKFGRTALVTNRVTEIVNSAVIDIE